MARILTPTGWKDVLVIHEETEEEVIIFDEMTDEEILDLLEEFSDEELGELEELLNEVKRQRVGVKQYQLGSKGLLVVNHDLPRNHPESMKIVKVGGERLRNPGRKVDTKTHRPFLNESKTPK